MLAANNLAGSLCMWFCENFKIRGNDTFQGLFLKEVFSLFSCVDPTPQVRRPILESPCTVFCANRLGKGRRKRHPDISRPRNISGLTWAETFPTWRFRRPTTFKISIKVLWGAVRQWQGNTISIRLGFHMTCCLTAIDRASACRGTFKISLR